MEDDYNQVSNSIYGAQEMDTWAGIRLLSKKNQVWRLEISVNHRTFKIVDSQGIVTESGFFNLVSPRLTKSYLGKFFSYFDPAIIQFSDIVLKDTVSKVVSESNIELIWSETQFYAPILDKSVPRVIRSVNFEPAHVLAEDSGVLKFLKFFLKILGERKAARKVSLVTISPRDSAWYKEINLNTVQTLPLRQLSYLVNHVKSTTPDSNYFVVMGSTFEVRHNRRNLDYCLETLAPALFEIDPSISILIFGTRLPPNIRVPVNVQIVGFSQTYHEYLLKSLGVIVPYHGGAGMQSKVFEPLALGVPLVSNSKSIAGYPFVMDVHYLHADSTQEYVTQMVKLKNNTLLRQSLSGNSSELSKVLFSEKVLEEGTSQILKATVVGLE